MKKGSSGMTMGAKASPRAVQAGLIKFDRVFLYTEMGTVYSHVIYGTPGYKRILFHFVF